MYSVSKKKKKFKKNKIDGYDLVSLDGFKINSKKGIVVKNEKIREIKVIDKDLAYKIVLDKVQYQFNKLLKILTELLTSDDDTGSDLNLALNEIEKFRLEIKVKYREYLKKKDLEKMSSKLVKLKKEANNRLIEINENIKSINSRKGK